MGIINNSKLKTQKSKLQLKTQKFFSYGKKDTRDFAKNVFWRLASSKRDRAVVLALKGELGAGKTTFSQGILRAAGAQGPFTSPTFVIMKVYQLSEKRKAKSGKLQLKSKTFSTVYHFDAYRVGSRDIFDLGWEEIINNPDNLVLIEWPEKIKDILPNGHILTEFYIRNESGREILLDAHWNY
jgi:tRNA threonylcarbamoyladenosine biosynthesis protein TsaE